MKMRVFMNKFVCVCACLCIQYSYVVHSLCVYMYMHAVYVYVYACMHVCISDRTEYVDFITFDRMYHDSCVCAYKTEFLTAYTHILCRNLFNKSLPVLPSLYVYIHTYTHAHTVQEFIQQQPPRPAIGAI